MKEFDLDSLWQNAGEEASSWYQEHQAEIVRQARRRNESVLRKIERSVWLETILGVILMVAALWFLNDISPVVWWALLAVCLIAIWITLRYYFQFKRQVNSIPSLNIKASTEQFLGLLRSYKVRLTRLSLILTPIALLSGFAGGFSSGGTTDYSAITSIKFWLVVIPLLALAMFGLYYFIRWYYQWFFGAQEEQLEDILRSLSGEEE